MGLCYENTCINRSRSKWQQKYGKYRNWWVWVLHTVGAAILPAATNSRMFQFTPRLVPQIKFVRRRRNNKTVFIKRHTRARNLTHPRTLHRMPKMLRFFSSRSSVVFSAVANKLSCFARCACHPKSVLGFRLLAHGCTSSAFSKSFLLWAACDKHIFCQNKQISYARVTTMCMMERMKNHYQYERR